MVKLSISVTFWIFSGIIGSSPLIKNFHRQVRYCIYLLPRNLNIRQQVKQIFRSAQYEPGGPVLKFYLLDSSSIKFIVCRPEKKSTHFHVELLSPLY